MMHKIILLIGSVILITLVVSIVIGISVHHDIKEQFRESCSPTDLYVIANKGRRSRIYDCTGIDML